MVISNLVQNRLAILTVICLVIPVLTFAAAITYTDSWGDQGFNLVSTDAGGVEIVFSIENMAIEDFDIDGETMQMVMLPGVFLPNDEGMPNLPGTGRFIAIPEGASVTIELVDYRTEVYHDLNILPAPPIPIENDDSPPVYKKNPAVYEADSYYPESPVKISEVMQMRGVDAVIVGITPFQYNPVTRELLVYRDLQVRLHFTGGNGQFGEDRLRSRYWDPILRGNLLNYSSLPEMNYNHLPHLATDTENVEYLIIVPDDASFIAWADSLKNWRAAQGIITGIATLSEVGGNTTTAIENYVNNAYNNWDIPPVAVLLLSDYQSSGDTYGITSPTYNYGYTCVSDNIYADVNGDNLPEMNFARITAQNASDLSTMIGKMFEYERTPPTNPGFYDHPLIAGGWQTERWFILCCEVIYGFLENELGKSPVRQYAIYMGTPGSVWSTNANTYMVVNYFGPSGLGYIPSTPSYLTNWSGNATGINQAINDGCFILQHRDHGSVTGWGEPSYSNSNLTALYNNDYPFVFSTNCLTGKYNDSQECFTEAFHRMDHGAVGLNAASQTSYSFVNDTYVWGMYDSMWPFFDPGYGTDDPGPNDLRPSFAQVYGKYYLQASSWPYNPQNKDETYHLFHHHGDAFITLYSEVPQNLTVSHNEILYSGATQFTVTADDGSMIGLSVNGEVIGVAEGTGAPLNIDIEPQLPGATMIVTVTKCNYYRYMQDIPVIPPDGAYLVYDGLEYNDPQGNNNGILNVGETCYLSIALENIGTQTAENVSVTISTVDPYCTVNDGFEMYLNIPANTSVSVADAFEIEVSNIFSAAYTAPFSLVATDGIDTWEADFTVDIIPNLYVTLTPAGLPIVIPANGGLFNYNISVENNDSSPTTVDIWTYITLPNGSEYGPVINVPNFTLIPSGSIDRDRTQVVPSNAPGGSYTYDAYVGEYPNFIWDEDHFDFSKSTDGDNGAIVGDWAEWGEEFGEGESASTALNPDSYSLSKAHPNPFNPVTTIDFSIPEATEVSLGVYNSMGQRVAILHRGMTPAGNYSIQWNAVNMSSGVYFYYLQAGDFSNIKKCVLMK